MANRSILQLAVLLCLTIGKGVEAQTPRTPERQRSVVAFTQKISGGQSRPIVVAYFNGRPMKMMVHSNATFTAQLKHHQARAFHLTGMKHVGRYGIDRVGHVSDDGFSRGRARELRVGRTTVRNAPVDVFEVPQDEYGMLGINWIRNNHAVVDYGQGRVTLNPSDREIASMRKRLLASGYVAVPMRYEANRYVVTGMIANGSGRMVVATASSTSIDPVFAKTVGLTLGNVVGQGSGPTGTSIPIYALTSPVRFDFGTFRSRPVPDAVLEDSYAYTADPRPADLADAVVATLGSDFLTVSGAVVDFHSLVLFVR